MITHLILVEAAAISEAQATAAGTAEAAVISAAVAISAATAAVSKLNNSNRRRKSRRLLF